MTGEESLKKPEFEDITSGISLDGTPMEEALAAVWSEVLGIDLVGIHDNFFALGGTLLVCFAGNFTDPGRFESGSDSSFPFRGPHCR